MTDKKYTMQETWEAMKSNPQKLSSLIVTELGKMAVDANANEFSIKIEATIKEKRYKICTVTTVEEVTNAEPTSQTHSKYY